jgi:hypothetical protein
MRHGMLRYKVPCQLNTFAFSLSILAQFGLILGNLYIWGCSCLLLLGRNHVGRLFSNDAPVVLLVAQTVPAMALSLLSEYTIYWGPHT